MEEKKTKTSAKTEKISTKEKELIAENENLIKEIETLKGQVDEFKDKWMRNVAEFDNYKKRNAKLRSDAFNEGIASVIIKILPVGDNLDWALTLGLDEKTEQGIKGIRRKFDDTLKELEIEEKMRLSM